MITLAKIKRLFNRSKLASTITIKKYIQSTNEYGDSSLVFDSEVSTKGIVGSGLNYKLGLVSDLRVREGEMVVYFPGDVSLEDTETYHYQLVIKGITYEIINLNKIGIFDDTDQLLFECIVKPKTI